MFPQKCARWLRATVKNSLSLVCLVLLVNIGGPPPHHWVLIDRLIQQIVLQQAQQHQQQHQSSSQQQEQPAGEDGAQEDDSNPHDNDSNSKHAGVITKPLDPDHVVVPNINVDDLVEKYAEKLTYIYYNVNCIF